MDHLPFLFGLPLMLLPPPGKAPFGVCSFTLLFASFIAFVFTALKNSVASLCILASVLSGDWDL